MEFCTPPALKRKFEEADARADESALVRVFLDEVALLEKLRCAAAKLVKKRPKTWLQHPVNKAKVTAAHSPVDETLDRIAALSASIPHPSSLTPPVQDHQWQADDTERRRQRLARNLKGTGSGPTPCISAHRALQQLSSVPNPSGVNQNRTPATALASKLQKEKKREQAKKFDVAWRSTHCADPSDSLAKKANSLAKKASSLAKSLAKKAKWILFNQLAEGVVDHTTFLEGTEQFLELLSADQVQELQASSSCMSEYYHSNLDGAVMAIQNTGGNPAYLRDNQSELIELAMLPRLLAAVAFMVMYELCVCDCTLL